MVEIRYQGRKPIYGSAFAGGFDICANRDVYLKPDQVMPVPTGLRVQFPATYTMLISLRSSIGKQGVFMANSPGVIDSDYRGEIQLLLWSPFSYPISSGQRLAQGYLIPRIEAHFVRAELDDTERGEGGFGSTGE